MTNDSNAGPMTDRSYADIAAPLQTNTWKTLEAVQHALLALSSFYPTIGIRIGTKRTIIDTASAYDNPAMEKLSVKDKVKTLIKALDREVSGSTVSQADATKVAAHLMMVVAGGFALEESELKGLIGALESPVFTHGNRYFDPAINTGVLAETGNALSDGMKKMMLPATHEIHERTTEGITAYALAHGGFDSLRGGQYAAQSTPLTAAACIANEDGEIIGAKFLLQAYPHEALALISDGTEIPPDLVPLYESAIGLFEKHVAEASGRDSRNHEKDILVIDPHDNGHVLVRQGYLLPALTAAYEAVSIRAARSIIEEAGQKLAEFKEKKKQKEEIDTGGVAAEGEPEQDDPKPSIPGAVNLFGPIFQLQELSQPQNSGGMMTRSQGHIFSPILIPPPLKMRQIFLSDMQDVWHGAGLKLAETNDPGAVADHILDFALHDACKGLGSRFETALTADYGESKEQPELKRNKYAREKLSGLGRDVAQDFLLALNEINDEEFEDRLLAASSITTGTDDEIADMKAVIAEISKLVADRSRSQDIVVSFGQRLSAQAMEIQQDEKSKTALSDQYFSNDVEKGFQAVLFSTEKLTTAQKQAHKGHFKPNHTVRDGIAQPQSGTIEGLEVSFEAKNCTLHGSITTGIPNLTTQHGFAYNCLSIKAGVKFTQTLLVIHEIKPHHERGLHQQKITVFNQDHSDDKPVGNISYSARDISTLYTQTTDSGFTARIPSFHADTRATLVVKLDDDQEVTESDLREIYTAFKAARFAGGNVESVFIRPIVSSNADKPTGNHDTRQWQVPRGFVLTKLPLENGEDNLLEKMVAHSLRYKGQPISERIPSLKCESAGGKPFGFTVAGLNPITKTNPGSFSAKAEKTFWSEPVFTPVQLTSTYQIPPESKGWGGQLPWVSMSNNQSDNSYRLEIAKTKLK